jgi:hypothetical protein
MICFGTIKKDGGIKLDTNSAAHKMIISTDNDLKKSSANARKYSLFLIVLSVILIALGGTWMTNLSRYADDSEKFLSTGLAVAGGLGILVAIIYPAAQKSLISKQILYVYDDHIEGKACYRTANSQSLLQVYETYDKISSVSTQKNAVLLNLKDGRVLQCPAYNAEEIASAIRVRIPS